MRIPSQNIEIPWYQPVLIALLCGVIGLGFYTFRYLPPQIASLEKINGIVASRRIAAGELQKYYVTLQNNQQFLFEGDYDPAIRERLSKLHAGDKIAILYQEDRHITENLGYEKIGKILQMSRGEQILVSYEAMDTLYKTRSLGARLVGTLFIGLAVLFLLIGKPIMMFVLRNINQKRQHRLKRTRKNG